jgi:hypothetical protein
LRTYDVSHGGVSKPPVRPQRSFSPEFDEITQRINVTNQWLVNFMGYVAHDDKHQIVSLQLVDGKCGKLMGGAGS